MKGIPDYRFSSNCSTVTVALPSAAKVMPSADSDPEDQRFESSRSHQEQYLMGAALFVLHGFYGAVKERIRTARAPRFASRGAETPRWGVSGAVSYTHLDVYKRQGKDRPLAVLLILCSDRSAVGCYDGFTDRKAQPNSALGIRAFSFCGVEHLKDVGQILR